MADVNERDAVIEAIRDRLSGRVAARMADLLGDRRPEEIASLMGELSDSEVEEAFDALWAEDAELAVEVLPLLDRHDVSRVVNALPDEKVAEAVTDLPSEDATYLLEFLPEDRVDDVVASIEEAASREEIQERFEYPEGSAGRLMSTDFVALPEGATAGDAIRRLQEAGEDATIVYVYLVDAAGRLTGVVSLRQLLRVKPERRLSDLSPSEVVKVSVLDDQEPVAQLVAQNDLAGIPVVDEDGRLAGVVTHDDVLDVLGEEATEDMLHMAGTSSEDVIAQSVWTSARLRMPWLLVCLGGEMVSMKILDSSQQVLGHLFVALAVFMPIITAMGGNVGTQVATIVVRGLATGRIRRHDAVPVFWREIRTALVLAASYGLALGLLTHFVFGKPALFSVVVGLGLLTSMAMAAVFGTVVPMVAHAVDVDPAIATGPLVTTAMDVLAFGTYVLLAIWLLGSP